MQNAWHNTDKEEKERLKKEGREKVYKYIVFLGVRDSHLLLEIKWMEGRQPVGVLHPVLKNYNLHSRWSQVSQRCL